jgi:hypothetical protein
MAFILVEIGVCAIGGVLIAKARKTREPSELVFGLLLVTAAAGHATMIFGTELSSTLGSSLTRCVSSVGALSMAAGFAALYLGAWRFYRPDSLWALALSGVGSLALLSNWASMLLHGTLTNPGEGSRESLVLLALIAGALFWWGAESLAYHRQMRRRVALDLAAPLIATRFLMLAFCSLSFAGAVGLVMVANAFLGHPARAIPAFQAAMGFLAVVGVGTGYCAFASVDFYERLNSRQVED